MQNHKYIPICCHSGRNIPSKGSKYFSERLQKCTLRNLFKVYQIFSMHIEKQKCENLLRLAFLVFLPFWPFWCLFDHVTLCDGRRFSKSDTSVISNCWWFMDENSWWLLLNQAWQSEPSRLGSVWLGSGPSHTELRFPGSGPSQADVWLGSFITGPDELGQGSAR